MYIHIWKQELDIIKGSFIVVVIPVVPLLPAQQCGFLSSPVWRLSCSPGREHTGHSPGTQTAAPKEQEVHRFWFSLMVTNLDFQCRVCHKLSDLNSSNCCRASRVNSLHITGSHASDNKAPAQGISYHLWWSEGEKNDTFCRNDLVKYNIISPHVKKKQKNSPRISLFSCEIWNSLNMSLLYNRPVCKSSLKEYWSFVLYFSHPL